MCTSLAKKSKLPFAYPELVFLVPNLKHIDRSKSVEVPINYLSKTGL
jgi:hypothetical protein